MCDYKHCIFLLHSMLSLFMHIRVINPSEDNTKGFWLFKRQGNFPGDST